MVKKNFVELRLGDIIEIDAPKNTPLHQNTFYINYIDKYEIDVINVANKNKYTLYIGETGLLRDESIQKIFLLDRDDEEGYAKQNKLTPHTWIDIHIGGDIPLIITGEITNLDEDQIEVTIHPTREKIYIDFEYKGLPKNIPFEKFVTRKAPKNSQYVSSNNSEENEIEVNEKDEDTKDEEKDKDTKDEEKDDSEEEKDEEYEDINMIDNLNVIYKEANEIIFGDYLDDVTEYIEIPEDKRTYSIEVQANDLKDELLSTVPNEKRTIKLENRINTLINRFKQLRSEYSVFDEYDNVKRPFERGGYYKPLLENLLKLERNVGWIIPVVKQKQRIYRDVDAYVNNEDVIYGNLHQELEDTDTAFKDYNSLSTISDNKYINLYTNLNKFNSFISSKKDNECLIKMECTHYFDAIIDNLNDFYSSVSSKNENESIDISQYVIQRYGLGLKYPATQKASESGKSLYEMKNMIPNDVACVDSFLVIPKKAFDYSKVNLPCSDILTRSQKSGDVFMLQKELRENPNLVSYIIDDFENDTVEAETLLKKPTHYILDVNLNNENDKYESFLNSMLPTTESIIKFMKKSDSRFMSVSNLVKSLEPFGIYHKHIHNSYINDIRDGIKSNINKYKKQNMEKNEEFAGVRSLIETNDIKIHNPIINFFHQHGDLLDLFYEGYKINSKNEKPSTNNELLNRLLFMDNGNLVYDVISAMCMKSLTTPNDLLGIFEPPKIDDMSEPEKIKPRDCSRKYISKYYTSIKELQNDQNEEEVYYDKNMDDTPYQILDLYNKEMKQMDKKTFKEFFMENLVARHNVDKSIAEELATTMIDGKKRVKEGEYATLLLRPNLPEHIDVDTLTEKDKKSIEIEAETREKRVYYRRVKNNWVQDDSLKEENFIDTNTIFCNLNNNCFKNDVNKQCEDMDFTKRRLNELAKLRMKNEFDNRVQLSLEQLEEKIKKSVAHNYKKIKKMNILRENEYNKYNNLAYELSKQVTIVDDEIKSPYIHLRDMILNVNEDFCKQQTNILLFIQHCCREPLQDVDINENQYFYYCKETNTELFPISYGILANAYEKGTYSETLDLLCSTIGTTSDDEGSIIDMYTNYVLRKKDFMFMDSYNENGHKIKSHDIMEEELFSKIDNIWKRQTIFEKEETKQFYNIMCDITLALGVKVALIEEFVMKSIIMLSDKTIISEDLYNHKANITYEKTQKKLPPYEVYKNRKIFFYIAAAILIGIQTQIPSLKKLRTYPGCKQSFGGYPMDGVEDTKGIEYISCVMYSFEKKIDPWNALKPISLETYIQQIMKTIDEHFLNMNDVVEMYNRKKHYLILNPESDIPEEHDVNNWKQFLPPINKFHIKTPRNVSRDFEKELLTQIKQGKRTQHTNFNVIKNKIHQFGLSIIESINGVVNSKDMILPSTFTENSCCNENSKSAINYFADEDDNIRRYISTANEICEFYKQISSYQTAPILHHNEFTGIRSIQITDTITEEIIYASVIHYCNLSNELPIPIDLHFLMTEKIPDFPLDVMIEEQIQFLKKHGKKFTKTHLHQILKTIYTKTKIEYENKDYSKPLEITHEILDTLEHNDSKIIEKKFRDTFRDVLNSYKPNSMYHERESLKPFKNYLAAVNKNMYIEIVDFFDRYGNLDNKNFEKIQDHLLNIFDVSIDSRESVYNMITFIENSVYNFTKAFPSVLINGSYHDTVHKHWNLSDFHNMDIQQHISKYWGFVESFENDEVMIELLRRVYLELNDVYYFMKSLPIQIGIKKNNQEFHSLLDNDSIHMLYVYFYLSSIYEYIVVANDKNLVIQDTEQFKKEMKNQIDNNNDHAYNLSSVNIHDFDFVETDIVAGDQDELKRRVASILIKYLKSEKQDRTILKNYDEINKSILNLKFAEKEKMTKYLGSLDTDERKLEKEFQKYKMGDWNIGMQKALVVYDKSHYDKERLNIDNDDDKDAIFNEENDFYMIGETNLEYSEENDISNINEGFYDGDYYGDFADDEDFKDF